MPVEYAEIIDGLTGQWIAGSPLPTGGAISPYPTGAGGGFVVPSVPVQAPPVGSATRNLDAAFEAATYTTATGAKAWLPTASENALIDAVTTNPYAGLDELVEAGGSAAARGGSKTLQVLPYVGDVVGGVVEGAQVYGRTGSLTHATFAGGGAVMGSIAGTAIGGALGGVGGPVGVAVGGIIGGAIGGALGSALGQALANLIDPLPVANINGATVDGEAPFKGGQCYGTYNLVFSYTGNGGSQEQSNQQVSGRIIGVFEGSPNFFGNKQIGIIRQQSPGGPTSQISIASVSSSTDPNPKISGVQRIDGPDNCGDPAPDQELYDPTADPTKTKPTSDPIELPGPQPDPNPRRSPRGIPLPGPGIWPNPFPMPDPIPTPGPEPTPTPTGDDKKDPYPRPSPNPNPDPKNPNPTGQPGPDDEPCDPCAELKTIRAKLEETFSLAWALPECGTDFSVVREGAIEGQGLGGLSQKIDGLYQVLKVLHENTRCGNEALAIPETWNLKKSIETAQMIIVTKLVVDEDNPTYRRSFTIPHPRYSKLKEISRIKRMRYRRGSCQATIQLIDNSCCVLNCSTPAEAKKVSKYVLQLINPDWARTAQVKITEKINLEIQPAFVEFHVAKYFQTSDERILPLWSQRIP
ncbi:hypothetical protein PGN35_000625 [Nodosilinea sp. PGN35]|uniref:hypothetical protein n=1 Tax=Nodosilinea sp. PGN35 TaxID=3020489 RepID=UPI0023B35962|nr:hypothetical protein [Nodosilinea sp. TSF1-S3]MDF0369083.1 hypothetical protein [Nodosilinea sp. TSF1-S3]